MTKASRWAWIVSLVAVTGAGLVLVFLLSIATNSRGLYEKHYVWLFWVNLLVAALLLLVIGIASVRLLLRVRRGKFGSRLLLRLAAIFAMVGVVPGLLIYTVSYQFVSRSIETWFDVKVEGALDAGLNLGRGTLDAQVNDLASKTRLAAERLADSTPTVQPLQLERLREQLSAQEVTVLGPSGQVLLTVGPSAAGNLSPDRPTQAQLRQARSTRVLSQLEGLDEDTAANSGTARIKALAFMPSTNLSLDGQDRFLLVTQLLPSSVVTNALAVQAAYREYQQRSLARDGLRRMYIGTLTLTLILAVFGALLLAVTLGNQLARPLLVLAEGVRQVARGDLTRKQVVASRDELSGLTRSFADMTEQLSDARSLVQRSLAQLEAARTNLQTILDNLTAGVIVFDRDGRIDTVNPGATRILRLPLSAYRGRTLAEVPGLESFGQAVLQRFDLHRSSPEAGERDHWQDAFDLQTAPDRDKVTLLVRGAAMPHDGRLMVFDDISDVVSAQRAEAWSEVARRLAHEIKNPLTPIQLSAERLQHKLESKLEGLDQAMLVRSVGTIVSQVQAMKTLVNEFRDYARLPAARPHALDLNALVAEVLTLYATAQESGQLRTAFAADLPPIIGDTTQLRQVIHNLVQNATDAVAERPDGLVRVATELARTEQGEVRAVRLQVIDNGPGFADKVLKRAFEPYVTTKSKGTGLGLAVVKKIADEHGARIRLANLTEASERGEVVIGAQVSLSFSKFAPVGSAEAAAADSRVH
ncbi:MULTISPECIES: ATP-binding protein [unclassified Rhizobacter]|uniref:sensor histidine kinase n=1 Tax=unclassified Rhizobacter TaxID=2640088 RepID=UPI0006FD7DA0|nr:MULTISPECIES: ATP-binding protein [unclassified Rhizobacter]KQU78291.1 PAS domain-containing sensor histidine kinase [Rhizobacter sp. Root29]KQW16037.1 PAS domain-containing sensor histidine kinase [Rhizobacter sp. Root1238]KRB25155.1 PAS domain-containing sensor histidine kinase [Rhizobacter sp. Root16D2]